MLSAIANSSRIRRCPVSLTMVVRHQTQFSVVSMRQAADRAQCLDVLRRGSPSLLRRLEQVAVLELYVCLPEESASGLLVLLRE